MEVEGGVAGERNRTAVHEPADAAELGIAVQVVLLQEQEDVVLIDLDDAEVHRAQVHGAEGEDETALVRKDVAFQRNLHGRKRVGGRERGAEVLGEGQSAGALQALVHGHGEISVGLAFEIDPCAVVFYVDGLAEHAGQLDEAFLRGGRGKGLAEADLDAGIAAPDHAGVDHLEDAGGGDDGLQRGDLAEAIDLQGNLDGRVLVAPGDARRLEAVGVAFAGERHGGGRIDGQGDVFLRGGDAELDGAFEPGLILDGDAVQGEGGHLGRRLDAEGEGLALGFLDVQYFPDLEGAFIDYAFLQALGDEFHDGGAEPALGAFELGLEGEQAARLLFHGHGRGQFDADGRSFGDDAARVGAEVGCKGGVGCLCGFVSTRRDRGKKAHKGPETEFSHSNSA